MSRFREQKARLAALLNGRDWKRILEKEITSPVSAREMLNPLLALLARPDLRWQAVCGLGLAVPVLAKDNMESARVVMRRFMWSLNEESGNLGWGVPEAMGCILAESPALAAEYSRIFLSYGYETGKNDNFLDHAPLRRGVYWGVGYIAGKAPETALPALPHLVRALEDEDRPIRGMAAWALRQLAASTPTVSFAPEDWQQVAAALGRAKARENGLGLAEHLEFFDGQAIIDPSLEELYQDAEATVEKRLQ